VRQLPPDGDRPGLRASQLTSLAGTRPRRPGRRAGPSICAQACRRLVASGRSPRARSSPTPSATQCSSSMASRSTAAHPRAPGRAAGPAGVAAARPVPRAAIRASAAARRPSGSRASPWRSPTSAWRAPQVAGAGVGWVVGPAAVLRPLLVAGRPGCRQAGREVGGSPQRHQAAGAAPLLARSSRLGDQRPGGTTWHGPASSKEERTCASGLSPKICCSTTVPR
jgi:hypothetical protein